MGQMESLFFITKSYAFRYNSMHPTTIITSGNVSNSIDYGRLAVQPHTHVQLLVLTQYASNKIRMPLVKFTRQN